MELLKQTGVTLSPAYAVLLLNSMSAFDLVWVIETPEKSSFKANLPADIKKHGRFKSSHIWLNG